MSEVSKEKAIFDGIVSAELRGLEGIHQEPAVQNCLNTAVTLQEGIKSGDFQDKEFVVGSLKQLDSTWVPLHTPVLVSGIGVEYDTDTYKTGIPWVVNSGSRVSVHALSALNVFSQGFVVEQDADGTLGDIKHLVSFDGVGEDGQPERYYYGLDIKDSIVEVPEMSFERAKNILEIYAPKLLDAIDSQVFKDGLSLGQQLESLGDIRLDFSYLASRYHDDLYRAACAYVNEVIEIDKQAPYSCAIKGSFIVNLDTAGDLWTYKQPVNALLMVETLSLAFIDRPGGSGQSIAFCVAGVLLPPDLDVTYECHIPIACLSDVRSLREHYYGQDP